MEGMERNSQPTKGEQIDSVGLLSWGANSYGQLGQGHKEDQLAPVETAKTCVPCIPSPGIITGGGGHTLMVAANGSLWVCGSNSHGQLGLGHREDIGVLTQVNHPFNSRITHIAGGWDFTVACSEEGSMYTWGGNAFCQLGRKMAEKWSGVPEKVELPAGSSVVSVAAGLRHALAVTVDGSLFAWGHNKKGQACHVTGDDDKVLKAFPLPQKLNLPIKGKAVQVIAGAYHSGVLTETGKVYSWGRADYGQLGRSCDGPCDHVPRPVAGMEGVQRLVCGSEHCLASSDDGRLLCWGWNEHGMCGTGDESDVTMPVQVALPAKRTLTIGCGAGHSFAFVSR
ncbi:hypothetical protein ACOMHN_000528 [Nucella lapillus]